MLEVQVPVFAVLLGVLVVLLAGIAIGITLDILDDEARPRRNTLIKVTHDEHEHENPLFVCVLCFDGPDWRAPPRPPAPSGQGCPHCGGRIAVSHRFERA